MFLLLERFVKARPYLYHLTHRENLTHIRDLRRLFPAAVLMERSGNVGLMRTPRRGLKSVSFEGRVIIIRDQDRLHEGNTGLARGYAFPDLIRALNRQIFFWPGTAAGPIGSGMRHFERYADERPFILRVEFESLHSLNSRIPPLFCRYNSGSPRCTPPHGRKSPRGPNTFVSAANFNETPGKVVEVTFSAEINLPPDTQFSTHPRGPWKRLL